MSTFETLPVILVSAANEAAATTLISELVDNDVTDDYLKVTKSPDRVWRLVNKYYTANVRVHSLTDHGRLNVDPNSIEAHIIYITEDELREKSGVERAAARSGAGGSAGAWQRSGVRLLLAECAAEPTALCAWAAAARALALALRGAGQPLLEARAALHAHRWRGLARTGRAQPPPAESGGSSRSGSDEEDEASELRAVEHAEAFAAALGALGPALEARAPLGGGEGGTGEPPAARLDRAEATVAAFCRALGYDLDAC